MRTTVTLDPDVERLLKDTSHRTRRSFKETLNNAVRRGLAARGRQVKRARFRVQPRAMGVQAGIDSINLADQVDDHEIDAFLSTTRKLLVRGQKKT